MPKLVVGTARFKEGYGSSNRPIDSEDIRELLKSISQKRYSGIEIDTAVAYGEAESLIGGSGFRGLVHTKISRKSALFESSVRSLRNLKRDTLSTLYFHEPDSARMPLYFFRNAFRLVQSGHCENLGLTVYSRGDFLIALSNPFVDVIQIPGNVLDKRISSEDLKIARRMGKKIYLRSLFLQGVLTTPSSLIDPFFSPLKKYVELLGREASNEGLTVAELLIAHAKETFPIAGIVIGLDSAEHLERAHRAMRIKLRTETMKNLDNIRQSDEWILDPRNWPQS